MAFITETDYDVLLRSEISKIIDTTTERTKLQKAEGMAIAQIKNYLGGRYDLDAIFIDAPTSDIADTRDQFLVMTTIDIALYHLWSKESGNNIPQTRIDRYGDAIEWLKAVQKGEATNLPIKTIDNNPVHDIRIWSKHESTSNRY